MSTNIFLPIKKSTNFKEHGPHPHYYLHSHTLSLQHYK